MHEQTNPNSQNMHEQTNPNSQNMHEQQFLTHRICMKKGTVKS